MASKVKAANDKTVVIAKTPSELQKMRLDKLMKNPTKEVVIPEKSKEWNPRGPQEFIRNVWGSSAGAGSGDFHVYRGVRRREYARQKFITEKAKKENAYKSPKEDVYSIDLKPLQESLDDGYIKKVEENKKTADERTAKKRAKRLKKKANQKNKKPKKEEKKEESEESDEESGEEEDKQNEGDKEGESGGNGECEQNGLDEDKKVDSDEIR